VDPYFPDKPVNQKTCRSQNGERKSAPEYFGARVLPAGSCLKLTVCRPCAKEALRLVHRRCLSPVNSDAQGLFRNELYKKTAGLLRQIKLTEMEQKVIKEWTTGEVVERLDRRKATAFEAEAEPCRFTIGKSK